MNNKKSLTWIIRILLIITIVSGGLLFTYVYSLRRANDEFNDLAKTFHNSQMEEKVSQKDNLKISLKEENLPEEKVEEKPDMTIVFKELHDKNNDIVGWISIPDTKVNYPVMHTPDNPEYYLHRNFEKQYSISGVPFIDAHSSLEPRSDNILIHGHNMKNGSMFTQLLLYKEKEFLEKHPTIEFYTFSGKQIYDIISVFPAEVYTSNSFNYHDFNYAKDKVEFDNYIANAKKASLFETGVTAEYGDHLLTLSTCAYHTTNGRFAVIAKAREIR